MCCFPIPMWHRVYALACGLHDAIVTDHRCCIKTILDVCLSNRLHESRRDGITCPDTGETVCLQLQPHRTTLRSAAVTSDQLVVADDVLHVMAVFMRDDVRLSERATLGAEITSKLIKEAEVDVDLLVTGAVERSDGCSGRAARSLHRAPEEHCGRLVIRGLTAR